MVSKIRPSTFRPVRRKIGIEQIESRFQASILPGTTALLLAVPVIFCWHGIWGLMDLYVLPEDRSARYLISIGAGLLLILLIDLNTRKRH